MDRTKTKEKEELNERISLIENGIIKTFVIECLNITPKYFWRIPASSSGMYHPVISLGIGGLVRHTIKAVDYGVSLCEKNSILGLTRDKIIASLILHDTCKAGVKDVENHSDYPVHAYLPRKYYKKIAEKFLPKISNEIFDLIDSHMGEWSEYPEKIPETREQKIVHFADYLASRKNQPILDYSKDIKSLETYDKLIIL
ncbi:MAG: HD domain-containing protein [Actinobacteria bacterium]|nr:HD domain-containing protein [Actinomycetota bacterium]